MKPGKIFLLALFLLVLVGCQNSSEIPAVRKTLQEYMDAWTWANTPKMYQLLTAEERSGIPFEDYDKDFEDFPLRPYQFKFLNVSIIGKTARVKTELLMPALTDNPAEAGPDKEMVSRNRITFFLKKEGPDWKVSEKETYKK